MTRLISLPVLLLFISSAHGQLRLDGGTSTMFGGSGFETTMYLPNTTLSGSIGYHGGFVFGASDTFLMHGFKTTVGDETLGFSFDGVGLGLALKGVAASRRRELECNDAPRPAMSRYPGYTGWHCKAGWEMTAFVGATGVGFFTPFATATKTQHVGTGILFQYSLKHLTLSSLDVIEGGKYSLAQGASYSAQRLHLSGSGGLLNNQKYFSGSAVFQPIHGWSLYANHQSFFIPYAAQSNGVGTNLVVGRFTWMGGLNESTSLGRKIVGENIGGGVRVGFVREQSSWYKSTGQTPLLVHSITETLRHWTLTQAVTQAAGRNSYSFGGGYSSNRISASVSHSIQFLLNGRGYQQVTGVQISFRIHDTVINAQTVADPFGKIQYSAYAESYVQTGLQVAQHETHSGGGKFLIQGKCFLPDGSPVEGCAIRIGKEIVYSNRTGMFDVRARNIKAVEITVPVGDFTAPGTFEVISAPATATPGKPIVITVARR
jgi:hypothetical protein